MEKIRTQWFDKVDRSCPLPEYPRPQLQRENWICLNGAYDYLITDENAGYPTGEFDGQITVPFAIESELSGVCKPLLPSQRLWYKKDFELDESFKDKRCIIHFGAVDWQCEVFINKRSVGKHTGGYCPFSIDITDVLRNGTNRLVVKVYDPTDEGWQQRGKQVLSTHGFWYTATSGIWQTVWLEPVESVYVKKIKLLPDIDNSVINVMTEISSPSYTEIKASVYEGDKEIFSGAVQSDSDIFIPSPKLWSPEAPFLYDLKLEVYCDDKLCDTVKSYFGMRKFSIGKDNAGIERLFLNNEPYFQRGLLDQGYFCEGVLTPPTDEAMVFDIQKMKDLGFNMLRKHIKVEPARWYYHCDRIGMIVWQDMISGGAWIGNVLAGVYPNLGIDVKDNKYKAFSREKPEWRENYKTELFEMIDTLYNVVSIYCWVPFNEGWGQFDAKEIAGKIKEYDSSRIVDHASGWHDQNGPDLRSMHKYILPIPKIKLDGRPFVISEFGGYSQNIDGHVWNKKKSFGYVMFGSKEKLTRAYRKLMEKQIMPKISKGLSAFVYTQVTDVEFEVNGIYTYDRKLLKIEEDVIKLLNKQMRY